MTPEVSVVIPMFNASKFIYQCLYSCTRQTFKNIEVIVIDDCSTDNSVELVNEFIEQDNGIPIFIHSLSSNYGTAFARNTGIRRSKSPIIALLDADDMLTHDSIESRLAVLKVSDRVMICGGYSRVVYEDDTYKSAVKTFPDVLIAFVPAHNYVNHDAPKMNRESCSTCEESSSLSFLHVSTMSTNLALLRWRIHWTRYSIGILISSFNRSSGNSLKFPI